MLITTHPRFVASVIRESEKVPILDVGPVGVFAGRVVVVREHHEPGAGTGLGPLEHLAIASRVAESRIGPPADEEVDGLRLARRRRSSRTGGA